MVSIDLRDRVALVTGGGRGIGLGIARVLHECGARVVVNDLDPARAKEAAESLGGDAVALPGDVADVETAGDLVSRTLETCGRIDVLVNNAGIGGQVKGTLRQDVEEWQRVFDLDLRAPYVLARAAGRPMCEQGSGVIVNIASVAGLRASAADNDYGPAKAALIHMTKSLALDFAAKGVRVNCIAPGTIQTPLFDSMREGHPAVVEAMLREIPLSRVGEPAEIGNAVAFLASDLARYVTGVVLPVDGGMAAGVSRPRPAPRG